MYSTSATVLKTHLNVATNQNTKVFEFVLLYIKQVRSLHLPFWTSHFESWLHLIQISFSTEYCSEMTNGLFKKLFKKLPCIKFGFNYREFLNQIQSTLNPKSSMKIARRELLVVKFADVCHKVVHSGESPKYIC
jgi:hypothetical protein